MDLISAGVFVLHAGHSAEITLLEYLFRILLQLVVFGVIVLLTIWGLKAINSIRVPFVYQRDGEERNR